MARIRTIKPDFFRHEGLQDLEIANPGMYPMMVFEGLWGHCDSKGRFEWKPRMLKLDILPFLPFSMADTLEILERAGMVNRYTVGRKEYGEVPTFEKHQRLSGKELNEGEKFPEPTSEADGKQRGSVGEIPESQEGKGREKEGKGENPTPKKPARFDPLEIDLPNCITAKDWAEWISYRRSRKLTTTLPTMTAQVINLAEWFVSGGHDPAKIIQTSIANGWQGLFEPKQQGAPPAKSGKQSARDSYAAQAAEAREQENGNRTERDITGQAERIA